MKNPQVNDIVKLKLYSGNGRHKEVIGRLKGYVNTDFGQCVLIEGHDPIYKKSIVDWEILTTKN